MRDDPRRTSGGDAAAAGAGRVMLEDLKAVPRWATHMGAIEGALQYLGREVSPAWLYGATGYAFALNIHNGLCPSGPYTWNEGRPDRLGRNVGYVIEKVANASESDYADAQAKAWDMVRRALGKGMPCYAFDIEFGDYFVVHGHDRTGYYYRALGSNETRGPLHWQTLGKTGNVGVVLACTVGLCDPAPDVQTVRDALDFALEMQEWPGETAGGPAYTPGVRGYDVWIEALGRADTNPHGAAFNAQFWAECRRFAVEFLREAKQRLARADLGDLLDEAVEPYRIVRDSLAEVAAIFPMHGAQDALKDPERVAAAGAALDRACDAEWDGLTALERVYNALQQ